MSKEIKDRLIELYQELDFYYHIRQHINDLETEIERLKNSCKHPEATIIEEGTEFDGYDRNEFYAIISCPDCGERITIYDKWKAKEYKLSDKIQYKY